MKNAQDHLETQLFQEYQAILDKYRDKIHAAQTKSVIQVRAYSVQGCLSLVPSLEQP